MASSSTRTPAELLRAATEREQRLIAEEETAERVVFRAQQRVVRAEKALARAARRLERRRTRLQKAVNTLAGCQKARGELAEFQSRPAPKPVPPAVAAVSPGRRSSSKASTKPQERVSGTSRPAPATPSLAPKAAREVDQVADTRQPTPNRLERRAPRARPPRDDRAAATTPEADGSDV